MEKKRLDKDQIKTIVLRYSSDNFNKLNKIKNNFNDFINWEELVYNAIMSYKGEK